ncbi:hypothetical protein Nepgr_015489 [Nepenthes gracilis]|uniref:BZIP domain-containing protein n=1 Tax=Nepenthes gracilis TaxID=150966 RepID=A0AAD3XQR2_NEPGR|nr:hypothetical protein Nepgr_015489 [Nepenthes gracilis]
MNYDSEEPVQCQFPVHEGFFSFTPNELDELLSFFQVGREPVSHNSGSEDINLQELRQVDEKKRKRMESNRKSAQRCRWRKKRHLEEVTGEVNRLNVENQELKNQLAFVTYHSELLRQENDQLRVESMLLRHRLSALRRVLAAMQLQRFEDNTYNSGIQSLY